MAIACQPKYFNEACHRYAAILKDLSPAVISQLHSFIQWSHDHPQRWALLKTSSIPLRWKSQILASFYAQVKCHLFAQNALSLLSQHNRLELLPDILNLIEETQSATTHVYLTVPKKLSSKALARLAQKLTSLWGKQITIHQTEDPSLLLGGVFLWDDFMLDASLSSMLSTLKRETFHAISYA